MLDGNGLGPLEFCLGSLADSRDAPSMALDGVGVICAGPGAAEPRMHAPNTPTQQFLATWGPQGAPRPIMHSCSG